MARIQIPLDVLTSRLNIQDRFAGFRNTSLSSRFANMRPVSEFLDFKRLSKPANFAEVQSRVNYNLGTFSSNYAFVFVLLSVYALITNPLLLFDIVLLIAGLWLLGRLNGQDLTIGTFTATSSQLYTGLLVTCGLLFLIASPFSTVLWLIGASGVVIIGHAALMDKPIDEAFSGEALDSDETDSQGAGSGTTSGNRRFASDPLRFTGIDLGSGSQSRNGHAYQHSEDDDDDDDSTEDDTQATEEEEEDTDDENQAARRELEEALGKQDVKLNKEELAALERRRKRLQAEAEAAKRRNGSDRKQRKEKEQRYAIPLSRFDSSTPPRRGGPSGSTESLSRRALPPATDPSQQLLGPPMGRFPPPAAARPRPRSGTSDSPPFDYQYVHAPPNQRHASDPTARPTSSSRLSLPRDEDRRPPSSSRETRDPFQFQTAGPRAPYPDGAAAARLDAVGPPDVGYGSRRAVPAAARGSPRRPRSREERNEQSPEDETTSDDGVTGTRATRDEIVVEPASPSPERPKAKKSSSSQPSSKRKSTGGRKRKGK
ncbi:PRA1 family protein-domain-containing protein [Hypoxylon sp. NC1633]|nr:PRA1 family protein-domain-containing protein [Hypoxylon sp. NC1633]